MAIDFLKKWNDTKKEYEDLTDSKKPRKTILGVIKTGHTGLESALTKCKAAQQAIETGMVQGKMAAATKALALLKAGRVAFVKAKDGYIKELDKAIRAEKEMENAEKSVQERGLKFLKKELDAIAAEIEAQVAILAPVLEAGAREDASAEALVSAWSVSIKASIKRAIAEIAKVKADPSPDNYNARVWAAARDILPELTRAKSIPGNKHDPSRLEQEVYTFNHQQGGAPAQVPNNSTPDQVRDQLQDFTDLVKRVSQFVAVFENYR